MTEKVTDMDIKKDMELPAMPILVDRNARRDLGDNFRLDKIRNSIISQVDKKK